MDKKVAGNIKLGMFIIVGLVIFVSSIYVIGSRKNLFSSSTRLIARFDNVGGLQQGNEVRFSGITVGNVEGIEIINSRKVEVTLVIDRKTSQFIKKDAVAVIGSDGLMGDKIINISSGSTNAPMVKDGDFIDSEEPVSMEDLMLTFKDAGAKANAILTHVADISEKINKGEGTIGKIISDKQMYEDLSLMLSAFKQSSKNAEVITQDFMYLSGKARKGEGSLGKLITDESIYNGLNSVIDSLTTASGNTVRATTEIADFTKQLNNKDGTVGKLVYDTLFAENIDLTLGKISGAADGLENTTERVNNSWLFNFLMGKKKSSKYK